MTWKTPNRLVSSWSELLLGDLFDRAEEAVAGVVDHDVEPSEGVVRGLNGRERLVAVGDVELQRQNGVAVLVDQVAQRLGVAGGSRDFVAAL